MSGESQKEPSHLPDPSVITQQVIDKEVAHLHEKMAAALAGATEHLETRLAGFGDAQEERMRRLEDLLTERDRRYTERFDAQELATRLAFESAERAVDAAFRSANAAVSKAEVSIEKRADASYVTINDLQRQLTALMPRSEAEQRLAAGTEKVARLEQLQQGVLTREEYDARHKSLTDQVISLASRLDKQEGYTGGANVDRRLEAIKQQIDSNSASIIASGGQKAGNVETRLLMFAFAGFVATILGIAATVIALWP